MDTAQAELERFTRDALYFEAHQEELLRRYPEQWVAIYHEQVVGADPDFERLLDDLRSQGVPPERALVEYVTDKEEILILGLFRP